MKYEKNKTMGFLQRRSFYLIITLCLLAIGAAAWMAYDKVQQDAYPEREPMAEHNSSLSVPSAPTTSEDAPSVNRVDTDKKDEPYEQSSSIPQQTENETAPNEAPVANNFILPILGNISKHFSADTLVYSETYKDMRLHLGIDISAKEDSVIKSCGSGRVVAIIDDLKLGKYIEIDHGNNVVARYCGFKEVSVSEGDDVTAVTRLGTLGTVTDECLDSSHLHLEFYKDEVSVDPLSIIYPKNEE